MLSQVSKVEAEFRNLPGVEDSINAIVAALGCPKSQAVTLCKFGYRSVEDVLNSQESEILSIPGIGKVFLSKWAKARKAYLFKKSVTAIAAALGCPKSQAVVLYRFGYCSLEDVLSSPESEIRLVPRIGKGFLSKWAEARRVYLTGLPVSPDDLNPCHQSEAPIN